MKKPLIAGLTALSLNLSAFAGSSPSLDGSILDTQPASSFQQWRDGKYALGNWGGLRDTLEAHGVDFFAYYAGGIALVTGGGLQRKAEYADDFYFGVNLYLDKLIGIPGLQMEVSGINRDGESVTPHSVGGVYDEEQMVGGQTIFLYQVTLEEHLFDNKFSIKIGRFSASDDFNASPLYGFYMNNGIDGDIRNVLFDTQFSAYPFATWAARLKFDPTPEIDAQVGFFQARPDVFDPSEHGTGFNIGSGDGLFIIGQVGWSPEFFKKPVPAAGAAGADGKDGKSVASTEMKGLPGHYWVGGSISPWEGYHQFNSPELVRDSYGFYGHADQMVYQTAPGSDKGLTLFVDLGYYPQQNISIVPFQVNFGAIYKGLIPNRSEDRTIFGLIHGNFSRDYAGTVEAAGNGDPQTETVLEFGYRIQPTKFAYIQPDVQYVITPGGTGNIPNAMVIGAQMGVTF